MAALAAPDRDGFVAWTQRGIALAEEQADASYWLGPLLNNLGWEHYEAGRARRLRSTLSSVPSHAREEIPRTGPRSSSRATP